MSCPSAPLITNFWGIDIGGANLKLCGPSGLCHSIPFPMWTDHHRLSEAVACLIGNQTAACPEDTWDAQSIMAVTMTGELADCFESRREGVRSILDQLGRIVRPSQCLVYSICGTWLNFDQAKSSPWSVAASNWHALVSWCLRQKQFHPLHLSVIIDIGSTTVDIIPVCDGRILTEARTDRQRMLLGQLVYTGMERTPIHAIVRALRVDNCLSPVMAERFATIVDANLILGCVVEEPENCDTADGRPRTRACAMARLARMVGEDTETLPEESLVDMARQVCVAQSKQVARALERNLRRGEESPKNTDRDNPVRVLVSGHGRPLIDRVRKFKRFKTVKFEYLEDFLGPQVARCAPAMAVCQLCADYWIGTGKKRIVADGQRRQFTDRSFTL